jgi:hypothetical protein
MNEKTIHTEERPLSTADLVSRTRPDMAEAQAVAAGEAQQRAAGAQAGREPLAALFVPEMAEQFRSRWDDIQIGFVDDPGRAVQRADELVAQVMSNLAETFARERSELEGVLSGQGASTENLRVALQRYRSFFQRLLTL